LLDRETWIDEDLPVLKIIATRIGVELQDRILRRDLEAALVSRERVRLGRDLHDGILQSLAAASIQLRVLGTKLDPELLGAVVPIRDILAGEAARIRAFVEQTRTEPVSPPRAELGSELRQRAEILAQRWDCAVDVAMKHIIEIPHLTASHLCFILDEAVSNAVRHGKARHILVSVSADDACLEMTVRDDGVGFPESRGTGAIWPLSLRGRIEDIGGTLEISSSDRGTILMVRLVV
jgi:signal transduction histidine kinase